MSGPDGQLLGQAAAGDADALGVLLTRHAPRVSKAIAGRIPKRWRSVLSEEDVLQQTFADAFRKPDAFVGDNERTFVGWLSELARCNLYDAIRMLEAEKRGGNRRRVARHGTSDSHSDLLGILGSTGSTPSRHAAADEANSLLEESIQQLPHNFRRVVEMYDLQAQPIATVAEALGKSPGAVYMLRARAHDWLREIMGDTGKYFSDSS